jgi:hypothetical protein
LSVASRAGDVYKGLIEERIMKRLLPVVCLMAAMLFLTQDCHARRWQVSPMLGYSIGGHFEEDSDDSDEESGISLDIKESPSFALAVNTDYEQGTEFEIFYSRQATELEADEEIFSSTSLFDLDVHYLHIGGTVILTRVKDFFGETLFEPSDFCEPYLVGTLGATHLKPRDSDYDPVTRFSASLGFGTRLYARKNLGFRFEARGFATLINSDTALFSNSRGMKIYVDADAFAQAMLNAGLFYDF